MSTTEARNMTETKLKRIAWLSKQDHGKEFNCLMHLFNTEYFEVCFHRLDGKKAVGIDGMTKEQYGEELQLNLTNLWERMLRMAYIPLPVKEVLIPKEGKPGATRPLGIGVFEDKIVQRVTQQILESIYDPIFLECSHGFRPEKSCHTAIEDLMQHLYKNDVETVIDVDLANFFGTIDHDWLVKMLRHKIKDEKFIRYIIRMFKAGVLTDGELKVTEEGVPQGSICSPVLANIFAHYVIDLWIEKEIKLKSKGRVHVVRYADDMVICCNNEKDAMNIREQLSERLDKFNLRLNEEKTKLVNFSKSKVRQGISQGTFDFLGFTFYWGRSKRDKVIPKLRTSGKTMKTKLKSLNVWAKGIRNTKPLRDIWKTFKLKIGGHFRYYGISHNIESLKRYHKSSLSIMFKWLNRRSQRNSFSWEKFCLFLKQNSLPKLMIYHRLF